MLHELLAAVRGHGGDIFTWKESKLQVTNDLGLLHPCEIAIIEEMLGIATHFRKITAFCDTYDIVQVKAEPGQRCGLYLSALAAALRATTTTTFHSAVVQLECRLLADPHLPLSAALLTLQPLAPCLATLAALVTQIEEKQVHGCQILETVHRHTAHSVAQVKQVLRRIEQKIHAVLYYQLTHWLLHGLLLDPHDEFFITTTTMGASTTTQSSDMSHQMESVNLEESESEVGTPECNLRLEMLPAHIPLYVAEKILFIGEFILVFERGTGKKDGEGEISLARARSGWVLKEREQEFRGLLAALGEEETFSITQFSHAVETIRNCVSEELWKLVMEAGLLGELSDLKAVFLLGRGELFQALIPSITPFLQAPTSPYQNFNGLFQLAGRQVLMEDSVLEKFTLSLKSSPASTSSSSSSSTTNTSSIQPIDERWKGLRLQYHAQWPLHKLFTSAAQDKYNAIFSFLLDVRRAQYRLQQLWLVQMRSKGRGEGTCLQWTLRHHMTLLIDNIQYYLQADVLESQHWQLVREVSQTRDYQQLATAHHTFLASVAAQCFLHNAVVSRSLHHLLGLVHRFCTHVESPSREGGGDVKVEQLHEEFERAAAQLFFVLSNLRLHRGVQQQHTSQLIMRIDYNRYYSHHSSALRRLMATRRETQ